MRAFPRNIEIQKTTRLRVKLRPGLQILFRQSIFEYVKEGSNCSIINREMNKESIIKIEGLGFEYTADEGKVTALSGVDLEIGRGSFTAIIGRNGSGKSTLAKNINALLIPTEGCVIVGGYDTREEEYIWEIRRMAGMVFQNPDNQLVSAVVEDDVAFGPENLGLPREEIIERIRISLESVDMYEHRKMAPHKLSGGQKQRVAIAGVIAMKPEVIIFDEPTAMLDPEGRQEVLEITKRLHREGATVLLITHFMEETVGCDRVIIMDHGRVCMDGTPQEVFDRAEEIRALGLKLPFSVELAEGLRALGVLPEGGPMLSDAELAEAVLAYHGDGSFDRRSLETKGDGSSVLREKTKGDGSSVLRGKTKGDGSSVSPVIVAEHLTHTYNKGLAYETCAVMDACFEIGAGEYISVIGHTGSGKSTLVQHMNGLLKPTEGHMTVAGTDISQKGAAVVAARRKTGMLFQYPEYQLFEETVCQDVAFGPKNLGVPEDEIEGRVREAMALVGLDYDEFSQRSPFELSGGQKRMAAFAGVLAMRPQVLVLDEPTAGLDPKSHEEVLSVIENIREQTGCTIVIVSHNMDDVARLSDRIFVMAAGEIVKSGTPSEIFSEEEFLKDIGLGVPKATAFAGRLSRGGLDLTRHMPCDGAVLSMEDLLEVLSG